MLAFHSPPPLFSYNKKKSDCSLVILAVRFRLFQIAIKLCSLLNGPVSLRVSTSMLQARAR